MPKQLGARAQGTCFAKRSSVRCAANNFYEDIVKARKRVEADHERLVLRSKALSARRSAKMKTVFNQVDAIARDDVKFIQDLGNKESASVPDWKNIDVDFAFDEAD
jgi:hypothetical protein